MDVVTVDRLQFAFTVMFHYLFPIGTLRLGAVYRVVCLSREPR